MKQKLVLSGILCGVCEEINLKEHRCCDIFAGVMSAGGSKRFTHHLVYDSLDDD